MVHISDGVLSLPVLAVGWAVTLGIIGVILWWRKKNKGGIAEEIPKLSVMTGAFFVASLLHIPVGPTSVHLVLNGLLGVILGILALPAIFIGVILQTILFQHGGITTIGINTTIIGLPALLSYLIFKYGRKINPFPKKDLSVSVFGTIAGGTAVLISVLFLVLSLVTTGKELLPVATTVGIAHIPVIIIEAAITGSVVALLSKVKPELLVIEIGGEQK